MMTNWLDAIMASGRKANKKPVPQRQFASLLREVPKLRLYLWQKLAEWRK
jgi:hypothetical protein